MKNKHVVEFHSQKAAERVATKKDERDFTLQVRHPEDADYLLMTDEGLEIWLFLLEGKRGAE